MAEAKVTSVVSMKGGTGKTSVAVQLAGVWAARGRKVLVVDLDPQGAVARSLGLRNITGPTVADVLTGGTPALHTIRTTDVANLFVLPSQLGLSGLELELPVQDQWRTRLHQALAPVRSQFDAILVDTPPGLGVLSFLALVAADGVLICCTPTYLAWGVLGSVVDVAGRAGGMGGGRARVLGIIPTLIQHPPTNVQSQVLDLMSEAYGPLLLPGIVRRTVVEQSAVAGQPLTVYGPRTPSAVEFQSLAEEVDRRGQADT